MNLKNQQLKNSWVFYENYRADQKKAQNFSFKPVFNFGSFQQFAYIWNQSKISHLSNFFYQPVSGTLNKYELENGDYAYIDTISLFRQNIQPKWEDKANQSGGQLDFVIKKPIKQIQITYKKLIFNLIGQCIPYSKYICGIRFVDKTLVYKPQGQNLRVKIDFWFNYQIEQRKEQISTQLKVFLQELGFIEQKLLYRSHKKHERNQKQ